jgi:hypothetical protein
MATVADTDILVSWNFRHIVHFDKIWKFDAVNLEKGYTTIAIYSPMEATTRVSENGWNGSKDEIITTKRQRVYQSKR